MAVGADFLLLYFDIVAVGFGWFVGIDWINCVRYAQIPNSRNVVEEFSLSRCRPMICESATRLDGLISF